MNRIGLFYLIFPLSEPGFAGLSDYQDYLINSFYDTDLCQLMNGALYLKLIILKI